MNPHLFLAARLAGLGLFWVAAAAHAASPATLAKPTGRLNDTGATQCLDALGGNSCDNGVQDAETGRDVHKADPADGRAGFSFAKLGADGAALPASAAAWSCVADQVTGLVWEMKTDDGSAHDKDLQTTNLGDGSAKDASALVALANQEALCGRSDWRLPTRGELQGIVDYSTVYPGPSVDADWFPNSTAYSVWTATGQVGNSAGAWYVNFMDGYTAVIARSYAYGQTRLVAGKAPQVAQRFAVSADGTEVTDALTGLVWQRCSLGQTWDGSACSGRAKGMPWAAALKQAASLAKASGAHWRLPNAKELASLSDDTHTDPAIDTTAFPNTPTELYWASTPYTASGPFGAYAWTVYTFDGSVTSQLLQERFKVRLVRAAR